MSEKCCCCIPLYYAVATIGVLKLGNMLNVAVSIPNSEIKIIPILVVVVEFGICVAFANALLFERSLNARRVLL